MALLSQANATPLQHLLSTSQISLYTCCSILLGFLFVCFLKNQTNKQLISFKRALYICHNSLAEMIEIASWYWRNQKSYRYTASLELSVQNYHFWLIQCKMKAVSFFFFCLYNTVSNDIHLRTVTAQGITLDYSTNCLLFSHWENFWLNVLPKITVFIN